MGNKKVTNWRNTFKDKITSDSISLSVFLPVSLCVFDRRRDRRHHRWDKRVVVHKLYAYQHIHIYTFKLYVCESICVFLFLLCSFTVHENWPWWILWCRTSKPPRPKPQAQWSRTVQTSPQWLHTQKHPHTLCLTFYIRPHWQNILLCNAI